MMLEGISELPLHDGHVPPWLARIMKNLAKALLEIMVMEFGPDKVVERLSNPLWFQAFNNIIGMDWDSSGSTTVTTGILKEVTWNYPELGVLVLGGKGKNARKVPEEIPKAIEILNLKTHYAKQLERSSRLIAKIDSSMLQDGYTLYHHSLIVSENGVWSIIQQGMNTDVKMARRYHWYMPGNFFNDPHNAVSGKKHELVLNLVSRGSNRTRHVILDLAREQPSKIYGLISESLRKIKGEKSILEYITPTQTGIIKYIGKEKRILLYKPLKLTKRMLDNLRRVYETQPSNLEEFLLIRGLGPNTIRALTLVSDLIYNEPPDTNDPVNTPYEPFKYAYAIGGKDGVPYPVNKKEAEKVISILEYIINEARIGKKEKIIALKNLSRIKYRYRIAY
ncbi:MAG: DUF763 domain-containing protein [Staphylothermus sp.]|nr:DUF763 domain-containing protein [Staphylothermus sp.]